MIVLFCSGLMKSRKEKLINLILQKALVNIPATFTLETMDILRRSVELSNRVQDTRSGSNLTPRNGN